MDNHVDHLTLGTNQRLPSFRGCFVFENTPQQCHTMQQNWWIEMTYFYKFDDSRIYLDNGLQ